MAELNGGAHGTVAPAPIPVAAPQKQETGERVAGFLCCQPPGALLQTALIAGPEVSTGPVGLPVGEPPAGSSDTARVS